MFTKKHYYIIIIVSLAVFITNLDLSIVNIALPTLARKFNVNIDVVSRILLSYLLAYCGLLLPFGRLADIKGIVKIFKLGFIIFTISSLFCSLSVNITMLIVFRFIQGVGGSLLLSTFGAIIIQYMPSEKMGRVFGLMSLFGGSSIAIGAPMGGFILKYLPWYWLFLINIPIGVVALILAHINLEDKPSEVEEQTFDFTGAVLIFLGLVSLTYGLHEGSDLGWTSSIIIGSFLLSFVSISIFIIREIRHKYPVLDIFLFKNIYFSCGLLANLIACMVLDGSNLIFPFYFELARGYTPDRTGLLLMLFPILISFIGPVSGFLCDRIDPRIMCAGGMALLLVASVMIMSFNQLTPIFLIVLSFIIYGAGFALFFTASPTVVLSHAPENKEGMVNAINSFVLYLGTTLGICIFETIFSLTISSVENTSLSSIAPQYIVKGLHNVFIFAIIITIIGFMASVIAKRKKVSSLKRYPTAKIGF
ncbi:MAG TPA: MFS transporter [Candidatus Eremiobacteraeota bacterium]|nr:MAG: Multidrug resistance protein stp [bacterium ADurb.Bin363]HPZ08817.1 MFS transporter [Candidatus Eremiobacteraeota bacterium]